ncbi:unnamed protein product [Wickerhamomyces anomalus]
MNILDLPNTVLQKIVQNVRSVDAYISLYQFPQFKSIIDRTLLIQREARQNITGVPSVTQELYDVPVVEYIPQNKRKVILYSPLIDHSHLSIVTHLGVPLELFDSNRWPTEFWHNVLREEIYLPSHTKIICSIDVINRPYMHIGSYEEIRGMTARVDAPKLKQLVVCPQYGYAHILAKIQAPNLQFFHMGVNQRNFRNLERLNDFPKLQYHWVFAHEKGSEIDEIHTDRDLKELELSQASYLHQLTEIENLEKLTILTWHGPKWKLKKEYENVLKIFSILGAPWKLKLFTISVRVENSKISDFVSQLNYLEEMIHDKPKRPLKYKVYPSGNKHMVYKLMFDVNKLVDRQPVNHNIQFEPFENIFHRG